MITTLPDSVPTAQMSNIVRDLLAALNNILLSTEIEETRRIARDAIAKAESAMHTPSLNDDRYNRQMKLARQVMEERADVLRELAKS
jgi:hypothetical protein